MELEYKRLDERWFVLTKDLHFQFTLAEVYAGAQPYLRQALSLTGIPADQTLVLTAPKGFVCDLTSIPDKLQGLFKPDGPYAPAAALHDLLYQNTHEGVYDNSPIGKLNKHIDKFFADRIFLLGMRALDINMVTRAMFYDGVRLFGDSAYEDPNTDVKYPHPAKLIFKMAEPYYFVRYKKESGIPPSHTSILGSKDGAHLNYPNLKRDILTLTKEELNVSS